MHPFHSWAQDAINEINRSYRAKQACKQVCIVILGLKKWLSPSLNKDICTKIAREVFDNRYNVAWKEPMNKIEKGFFTISTCVVFFGIMISLYALFLSFYKVTKAFMNF